MGSLALPQTDVLSASQCVPAHGEPHNCKGSPSPDRCRERTPRDTGHLAPSGRDGPGTQSHLTCPVCKMGRGVTKPRAPQSSRFRSQVSSIFRVAEAAAVPAESGQWRPERGSSRDRPEAWLAGAGRRGTRSCGTGRGALVKRTETGACLYTSGGRRGRRPRASAVAAPPTSGHLKPCLKTEVKEMTK